jgi:hypothetical protein
MDPSASFTIENVDAAKISLPWARRDSPQRLGGQGVSQSWPSPEPIAWFFLPPPISHHVRAQASGKIASRKIVCSCERVRRFLPAIFSVRHPRKRVSELGLVSRVSPVQTALRNCTRDEGRPFEVGNQVLIASHRKLLSSKAMVVNVAEKSGQDSGKCR